VGFAMSLALLLFSLPLEPLDFIQIESGGEVLMMLDRADFSLPFGGIPLVDEDRLQLVAEELNQKAYRQPVNAAIRDDGSIAPEKKGQALDRQTFAREMYDYFYGRGAKRLNLPLQEVHPKVDSGLLAQVRKKTIGHYVTYYNPGNRNRAHNIMLAARAINNYVVLPGETFSFNKVVGKRTVEKGYLPAPIIVRGELSEGIGGGICQVSSTLFNAVDMAGVHIVQRYSHSRHVPYVPPGRDATVSWYGPDFVFQNRYAYPILVRAHSAHGQIRVLIQSFPELEYEPRYVPGVRNQMPEEGPAPPIELISLPAE